MKDRYHLIWFRALQFSAGAAFVSQCLSWVASLLALFLVSIAIGLPCAFRGKLFDALRAASLGDRADSAFAEFMNGFGIDAGGSGEIRLLFKCVGIMSEFVEEPSAAVLVAIRDARKKETII